MNIERSTNTKCNSTENHSTPHSESQLSSLTSVHKSSNFPRFSLKYEHPTKERLKAKRQKPKHTQIKQPVVIKNQKEKFQETKIIFSELQGTVNIK